PDPVHDRQSGHQEQAGEDGKNRRERAAGRPEGAFAVRFAIAKDENSRGDEREREESADVREIGERADIKKACRNAHNKAGNPRGEIWGEIATVNTAEDLWEEPVAGHGEPDTRLTNLEDE